MANPKKGTSQARNEFIWGWAFILPTMLGLIILNIYPIFKTIYESFFKTGDFGKGNIFIGFDNYVKLFHDAEVWQALLNTFKYAIVEVPFSIAIALVLAVLLNRKMKGRAVYRTIFFLPMVAAPAAIAMVWRWLFNSEFGLLNHIFHTKINWISDPKIAVYAIAVIGVWSIIGYNMVLFLSGLQEIPRDYYEAASIDGATGVKQFFHITIPLLSPTIFFVMVTRVIGAMQVFDLIFMEVWQALLNTFKYAIVEVPFSIAIALVLAVLLNRKMKGRAVYRTIFFLPMVAAPAAIAMVWRWLFNSEFGLLNHIFHTKINWISDPKIAVYAIAVIGVWSIIGYNMVLFLSGLQEIPRDYYEAASIDGATGVKQFFHITIPLLSPTIFFVMVTRVIGAMQVFDLIFMVMDRNSPALYKTQSLVYLFYQNSFVQNNKGYGSTIVVLLLVVIMIMTVFQNIAQKKWVHYN